MLLLLCSGCQDSSRSTPHSFPEQRPQDRSGDKLAQFLCSCNRTHMCKTDPQSLETTQTWHAHEQLCSIMPSLLRLSWLLKPKGTAPVVTTRRVKAQKQFVGHLGLLVHHKHLFAVHAAIKCCTWPADAVHFDWGELKCGERFAANSEQEGCVPR